MRCRDRAEGVHHAEFAVNHLGQPPDAIAEALEALAEVLCGIGVHNQSPPARIPRLLSTLRDMCEDVAGWSRRNGSEAVGVYADMVSTVANVTVPCAETTLRDAQAISADVVGLLRRWSNEPQHITRLAARPEWVLDGWEQICLFWTNATDDAERRAALVEMAQLVPVLPREASEWVGGQIEVDRPVSFRLAVRLNEDWRTGATVFDQIARNEHLRALAL